MFARIAVAVYHCWEERKKSNRGINILRVFPFSRKESIPAHLSRTYTVDGFDWLRFDEKDEEGRDKSTDTTQIVNLNDSIRNKGKKGSGFSALFHLAVSFRMHTVRMCDLCVVSCVFWGHPSVWKTVREISLDFVFCIFCCCCFFRFEFFVMLHERFIA